jgi:nucleotide-binding universal stress UspA family protein
MSWKVNHPVVVPFDFSDCALQAIKQALKIVEDRSQIHALHVLPFLIPTEPGVVWATIDDGERIRHALESMSNTFSTPEFEGIQSDVRIGDPGHVVSEWAEELQADLIVIGSHGRTGLTRLFLGSVAERVIRLAHCPVLVVKMPVVREAVADVDTSAAKPAALPM